MRYSYDSPGIAGRELAKDKRGLWVRIANRDVFFYLITEWGELRGFVFQAFRNLHLPTRFLWLDQFRS